MSVSRMIFSPKTPVTFQEKVAVVVKKLKLQGQPDDEALKETAEFLLDSKEILRRAISDGWEENGKRLPMAKIKLIITSLEERNFVYRKLQDSFLKTTGIAEYGRVHTAIQIGPIILEWGASSLICPCPTKDWCSLSGSNSVRVLSAIDIQTMPTKEFFDKYAQNVAEVITRWNVYQYSEYTTNCQHFTKDILEALNIDTKKVFTKKIEAAINALGTMDNNLDFSYTFEGDINPVSFSTHKKLDEICESKQLAEGSEDFVILKAYDRAFWMRSIRISQSPTMPSEEKTRLLRLYKGEDMCYFRNPDKTDTVLPNADEEMLKYI